MTRVRCYTRAASTVNGRRLTQALICPMCHHIGQIERREAASRGDDPTLVVGQVEPTRGLGRSRLGGLHRSPLHAARGFLLDHQPGQLQLPPHRGRCRPGVLRRVLAAQCAQVVYRPKMQGTEVELNEIEEGLSRRNWPSSTEPFCGLLVVGRRGSVSGGLPWGMGKQGIWQTETRQLLVIDTKGTFERQAVMSIGPGSRPGGCSSRDWGSRWPTSSIPITGARAANRLSRWSTRCGGPVPTKSRRSQPSAPTRADPGGATPLRSVTTIAR